MPNETMHVQLATEIATLHLITPCQCLTAETLLPDCSRSIAHYLCYYAYYRQIRPSVAIMDLAATRRAGRLNNEERHKRDRISTIYHSRHKFPVFGAMFESIFSLTIDATTPVRPG